MAFRTHIDNATVNQPGQVNTLDTAIVSEGVVRITRNDFKVTGTGGLSVNVAKGDAFIHNDSYVFGTMDQRMFSTSSTATEAVAITSNSSGNPRIDIICIKVDTGAVPGIKGVASSSVIAIAGTAAVSPTVPATPNNHLKLAEIAVANGAVAISNANITDKRPQFTTAQITGPSGFLINGKIVVSVASSNITAAIKTLTGNDPSAGEPVCVRIGDIVHILTSALSVAKNAGTNWFNAGGTELTGKEIDYFTYLGYNATDGVVIGFARILGNKYSDFSATTTSEKYAAISTITNAASTDYYEVVGRFAATLTGTNWSVPTFSPTNLINRPVYETRLLDWTSAPQPQGGSYTAVTVQKSKYQVTANNRIIVTYLSTGTFGATINEFRPTLPFTSDLGGLPGISYTAGVAAVSRTNSNIFQVVKFDAGNFATGSQGFAFNSIFDI